jgi:small subunit ribosomal protein S6
MSPAQVESLTERFISVLKENGASVGKTEYCGLRALAYLIKKNSKGHYVLMNITAKPEALKELERIMSISEDVLRFLSVVVEKHEEGPSALLKASRFREETGYSREAASHDRPRERAAPSENASSEVTVE